MAYEVHTIRAAGKKEVPSGTKIELKLGTLPGTVHVSIQLPGQKRPSDLGDIRIVDGVVELSVRLLFLSYAREDQSAVQAIADRLWQDGFLTWLDTKDLLPGDDWQTRIEDGIERADYVLVFVSKTSVDKVGFHQKELKYALDQQTLRPTGQRYLVPILLEECEPPRELRGIHWLRIWEGGAYDKLKCAIGG
jgi:hypothetical protein